MTSSRDDDLDRELQVHLDLEAEEHEQAGLKPDQARLEAHRAFGSVALTKEDTREVWAWTSVERVRQDVLYALRLIRKAPAFSAVTIIALALGIGINTALFSVVDGVLLRPLAFRDSDRLVMVWETSDRGGRAPTSLLNYQDWRERSRAFASLSP